MSRLFYLLAFPILLMFQSAMAKTTCTINQKTASGTYDKTLTKFDLEPTDDYEKTQLVYLKPDGNVVRHSYKDIENKTDWSDLNHSTFFNMTISPTGSLTIGFGDVDVSRKEVRHLTASVDAEKTAVLWANNDLVLFCITSINNGGNP